MDRLVAMEIFLAVVDQGGFASAARKLKISPPVVTRAVGELEAGMGVRLLTRTTRVVRVTDAGMRYASDCRRILADVAETEEAAAGVHGAPRGLLVVTAPVLFGRMYVTPVVTDYLRRYPEADVECRFVDRVVNMMEEGVDAAVRIGVLPDSSFQAVKVGQVRQLVCASPRYLKKHGVPLKPADLTRHDVVSAGGITASDEWRFVQEGRPVSVKVRPRMRTMTNDSAIAAVADGFGLTRVVSYMVAQQLAEGKLRAVLTGFEPASLPIHVVHHEGRHAARKVRAFLDLAIDKLRANAALGVAA